MIKSIKWVAVGYKVDGFEILAAGCDKASCLDVMKTTSDLQRAELIDARGHVAKKIYFEVGANSAPEDSAPEDSEEKRGRGRPKKSE